MEKDPQTCGIIGAAMEVHRELGNGFLEAVSQAALAIDFSERGIPFQGEVELPVSYKGRRLSCGYRADFICFESVLVETKAISALTAVNRATPKRAFEYKRLVFGTEKNLCESVKSVDLNLTL